MAKVEINAGQIKAISDDLVTIANDYNQIITSLYEKISKIEENGIWVSENERGASRMFISNVLRDKEPALKLGENIKGLSSKMKSYATSIEQIADSNYEKGSLHKIVVDTEAISKNVIPTAKQKIEDVKSASSMANSTRFPGDNCWSSVINELNECDRKTQEYYNKMIDMNEKIGIVMTRAPEEIDAMAITEIPKKTNIVK